jgi:hypothetical protein
MDRIFRAKTAAERCIDRLLNQLQHLRGARATADRATTRPSPTAP